jgi:hypothetical protein
MGVIVDSGMKVQIDQLEAKGAFSLADTFRGASEGSLESLAFMTNVPPEYQDLVASTATSQAMRAERDEETKEEDQEEKSSAEYAAAYQRQIDENMLSFNIDGEDVQISQGDLQKIMKNRVKELEQQKQDLLRNGGSTQQVQRIDNLLNEYNPVIQENGAKPADAGSMNDIKKLMADDPDLNTEMRQKTESLANKNPVAGNARTSFSSEFSDGGGISAKPLTPTFTQSASPAATPPAPTPSPTIQTQQQNLTNILRTAGF